jgi:TolB-like protein
VEAPKTTAEPERVASGTAVATVPAGAARTAQARRRVVAWAGAIATIAAGVGVGFFVRQRDGDRVADVAAPHSAPTTTLAVLPFRPLAEAGGPRDEVLELGMADSLITRLSAARTVIVSPVGAVRRYAGRDADPLQAARELGVDWVLEGTIQQRGDRMRVTARLLDVRDGSAAWSDSFDQAFTHVFDVQEAISRRVADVLMPRLGNASATRSASPVREASRRIAFTWKRAICRNCSRPTPFGARLHYTSGRSPTIHATLMPTRASPMYSAALSTRRTRRRAKRGGVFAPWRSARSTSIRNTATDSRCSGGLPFGSTGTGRAPSASSRARELNPSSIDAYHGLAHIKLTHGRTVQALDLFSRAREIDPHSLIANTLEGGHWPRTAASRKALRVFSALCRSDPVFGSATCSSATCF